ncbi:hypothetical protein MKX03_032426 [Papaver bracteatum]|nr:hypothetical protein MKX03_032426 [Papaver bracteatum]
MADHHHTISGLAGKLVTELEVNCNADKYYEIWKHHEDIPNAMPHIYTGVKVVEGHGTTSGCIKQWDYTAKQSLSRRQRTYTDETRTIHHSAVGGDIMNDYKRFDVTLLVNPKANGRGSIASCTIDYEKGNEDSPVPIGYLSFFQKNIEDLNSHLCDSE